MLQGFRKAIFHLNWIKWDEFQFDICGTTSDFIEGSLLYKLHRFFSFPEHALLSNCEGALWQKQISVFSSSADTQITGIK